MTPRAFNRRYDFIGQLAAPPPLPIAREPEPRAVKRPRDPATRPSHLKARQRFPTHPLTKIAKKLPAKLPRLRPAELETLSHEELKARFLRTLIRVKWNHKTV
ncbi:MAG TPA: hypothetical protein VG734_02385 [Lacunisphaera sp.]|nr:hypothetical protein [Lacunisphaera sp.]